MARAAIIIPIYNVERYVKQSLESACNQTESHIEIIAINDGSTDSSLAIVEELAAKDSRIKVISQENRGLSAARNRGIAAANSPVLFFLDSDDWMEPQTVERVLKEFDKAPTDIVTFGAHCFPEKYSTRWLNECFSPQHGVYLNGHQEALYRADTKPFVWRSAFSKSFLTESNLQFLESLPYGEDMVFYFEAYPQAKRVVIIEDKLIHYRLNREKSLMDGLQENIPAKIEKHLAIVTAILDAWEERGWFNEHGLGLTEWTLEFLCPETFACKEPIRGQLVDKIRERIIPRIASVDRTNMETGTRLLLERLEDPHPMKPLEATKTIWLYYRYHMGILFCLGKLLGR